MTDLFSIDVKVNSTISKIDSFVRNPTSPPPLDRELAELLTELNAASIGIEDTQQQIIHQQRIDRLKKKIEEYNRARKGIQAATRGDLGTVTKGSSEYNDVMSTPLKALKTTLEKENDTPMTVESLKSLLQSLNTEKSPDARALILNTAWSRLSAQGYNMWIQCGTIALENRDNTQTAAELAGALNRNLNDKKFTLNEIQSTIMTGTGKFGNYVKDKADKEGSVSFDGYIQYLTQSLGMSFGDSPSDNIKLVRNNTKATQAEKAFLISYLLDGYTAYDIAPDVKRRKKLQEQAIELRSSTTYAKVREDVSSISGGEYGQEQVRMQQGGPSKELTFETFMDNPALAIAEYPWTSLALIAGSIYQFGFMKTIGILFAGAVGIKALNELASKTEVGKQIKDGLITQAKSAGAVATAALGKAGEVADNAYKNGEDAIADVTKPVERVSEQKSVLTPSQELAQKEVMKESSKFGTMIQSHIKAVPNQNASLDDYIKFLQSSGFQNQKLDNILYSQNAKASIFQNEKNWDLTIRIPGNMDPVILKKILRQYLTGSYLLDTAPEGSQEGDKERSTFEKKYSLSEKDKNKTIKEILPNIYTSF